MKYFRDLAEITVLNNTESVEYCHLLVAEGEFEEIEKLLEKEKIQCSEEVGYLIKQSDPTFFEKANIPDKVRRYHVLACFGLHFYILCL